MELTDEQIIKRVREGDVAAFAHIVARHQGKVIGYVAKIVYDTHKAEDIAQEVFVALYQNIDTFDTAKRVAPYLYAIAHNRAISEMRRTPIQVTLNERDGMEDADTITQNFLQQEKSEEVEKALSGLRREYAQVLRYYYFDGVSYKQIARRMSVPVNTVRTYLLRAKHAIRKGLEGYVRTH